MKVDETFASETSVDFTGLHGVISEKIELLIATAVRISTTTTTTTTTTTIIIII
jgi:hypothetical protein